MFADAPTRYRGVVLTASKIGVTISKTVLTVIVGWRTHPLSRGGTDRFQERCDYLQDGAYGNVR